MKDQYVLQKMKLGGGVGDKVIRSLFTFILHSCLIVLFPKQQCLLVKWTKREFLLHKVAKLLLLEKNVSLFIYTNGCMHTYTYISNSLRRVIRKYFLLLLFFLLLLSQFLHLSSKSDTSSSSQDQP